ncbi:putative oxidoreductase [Rhizobium binae]|uniref:Oxidoreductase n=1 Tax=Rhizobium binae TaxID=1138190 RepID=A0ABV2MBC6_9HYPH|nr:DoxX family protein [Rhizobium binae]NKL48255.1 DoxX family membrane protein [Rhizobium leguminosarum bv. viciae]MBX4929834.1 DoxX family protein [Rhizobium binae]MBX4960988.1 DoxX family protein [Rhizobium binae]MBX4967210.1 DoxX family protein [Rhizobium binae]MBX4990081.1 DoxX family protein [Rhizobium binae]
MTMMNPAAAGRKAGIAGLYVSALERLNILPLSLVQLVSRLAVAHVFWQSSQSKLASWPATVQLFTLEYRLPVIDPGLAAGLATTAELSGSILIFLGLFSRLATLMLLGVISAIQFLVYPQNWPDHLLWTAPLLLILTRGAGVVSLDYVASRLFLRER